MRVVSINVDCYHQGCSGFLRQAIIEYCPFFSRYHSDAADSLNANINPTTRRNKTGVAVKTPTLSKAVSGTITFFY